MEIGNTLIAVFDNQSQASQALDALLKGGFSSSQARLTAPDGAGDMSNTERETERNDSVGAKIAHFFGFGDEHDSTYGEAVRRGSYVLSVDAANDVESQRASDIIERYSPVDIDERQAEWRQSGWQPSPASAGGDRSIPVVEEELQVGKREVLRGGIRVISRASERPVEATVNLREEHASVTRRPADRAATESEKAFKEQSFEVQGTAEEAVVGKTARVVEEVIIGKESSTRQQTVKDSVRKTEVEVKPLGAGSKWTRDGGQERRRSQAGYGGMERRGA